MIRNNITPIDLFNYIEDLIDDYNEPKEKYESLMNPWFSNRLTLRYEPHFEATIEWMKD
jgi:succinate dehydrogenase/fumarate reductase-like Fe-S protein